MRRPGGPVTTDDPQSLILHNLWLTREAAFPVDLPIYRIETPQTSIDGNYKRTRLSINEHAIIMELVLKRQTTFKSTYTSRRQCGVCIGTLPCYHLSSEEWTQCGRIAGSYFAIPRRHP